MSEKSERIDIIIEIVQKKQTGIPKGMTLSRQANVLVYSKNRIFPKNPVFLKILCHKIYGILLISRFDPLSNFDFLGT